jgi:ABC-type glycerol-3-phosphate transport system substrate-binding protein
MKWKVLRVSLLLLLLSSATACSFLRKPEEVVVTQVEYVERTIPLQPRPKPVTLYDIEFYAVTEENLDEFLERFEKENGDVVFFAISVPDYENIALNMGELRRFIQSQSAVILYYEENANPNEVEETDEEL